MKASFHALVDSLCAAGESERCGIEEVIWKEYGVERAVMALDMSQFSLTVRRSGILGYLGLIRRMQMLTRPIVERHGGIVIEFHADNLMAVFPDAPEAVQAAVEINHVLAADLRPDGTQAITVAIGIDYGRFLLVNGERCYGDTVNVAFKLGEDIARAGEILITDGARARLGAPFAHTLVSQPVSVSGLELHTHCIQYEPAKK